MNRPSLEEVEKTILESADCVGSLKKREHLEYLREGMNNLGYNFPDSETGEEQAYTMAIDFWRKIREQRNPMRKIPVKYLKDLPSTKVEVDGTECYVHGINHGTSFGPLLRPSRTVKEFIKSKANEYDNPSKNSKLLLEDGMKRVFDIKKGKEFNDHKFFDTHDKFIIRELFIYGLPTSVVLSVFLIPEMRAFVRDAIKSSRDMAYLPHLRETYQRLYLPQPLGMEYSYDNSNKSAKRSRNMSKRMIRIGHNADEVHAITGLAHESEIEFFLKNPDIKL
jgi:hypothetical protein